jgi:DNA-binding MarR family transcriptional regulator
VKYPKSERLDAPFFFLSRVQRANRLTAQFVERAGRDLDLSGPEAHVLGYVQTHPGGPLSELVRVFGHKRSTLTSILDRLESRGLVRRESSPVDRRSFLVHVTPAGRRVANRAQQVAVDLERRIAALVTPGDAAALDRVLAAFAQATGDARGAASRSRSAGPARRTRVRKGRS